MQSSDAGGIACASTSSASWLKTRRFVDACCLCLQQQVTHAGWMHLDADEIRVRMRDGKSQPGDRRCQSRSPPRARACGRTAHRGRVAARRSPTPIARPEFIQRALLRRREPCHRAPHSCGCCDDADRPDRRSRALQFRPARERRLDLAVDLGQVRQFRRDFRVRPGVERRIADLGVQLRLAELPVPRAARAVRASSRCSL